ncbi:MAG: TIGR03435 family protein [Candidatus Solibacter sp.]
MKRVNAGAVLALFVCSAVYGQAPDQTLQFEVASVKAVPPPVGPNNGSSRGCFGGPGSSDPVRYTCSNASVSLMAIQAYGLKPYQVRPPVITDTYRFNVEAKVPPGATADQVKVMLRNLLAERFKLAFHYEKRETQAYALVVAKGGLKLKESTPPLPIAPPKNDTAKPKPGPVTDAEGFTYFAPREGMAVGRANGLTRWVGKNVLMEHLAGLSNSLTGQPVIDSTGLKGKYDFIWTFSSDSVGERAPAAPPDDDSVAPAGEAGLTIFAALQKQLGLRLEPQKITIDAFVIDHAEKTPVEN